MVAATWLFAAPRRRDVSAYKLAGMHNGSRIAAPPNGRGMHCPRRREFRFCAVSPGYTATRRCLPCGERRAGVRDAQFWDLWVPSASPRALRMRALAMLACGACS